MEVVERTGPLAAAGVAAGQKTWGDSRSRSRVMLAEHCSPSCYLREQRWWELPGSCGLRRCYWVGRRRNADHIGEFSLLLGDSSRGVREHAVDLGCLQARVAFSSTRGWRRTTETHGMTVFTRAELAHGIAQLLCHGIWRMSAWGGRWRSYLTYPSLQNWQGTELRTWAHSWTSAARLG